MSLESDLKVLFEPPFKRNPRESAEAWSAALTPHLGGGPAEIPSVGWSLAHPPTTPHALDEEFNGLTGWTLNDVSATPINPYANFTSGGIRYSISARPSWLLLQPPADNAFYHSIYKTVSLPTNVFMYARLQLLSRRTAPVSNDQGLAIGFMAADPNDEVLLFINESDGAGSDIQIDVVSGGVVQRTQIPWGSSVNTVVTLPEYAGIHKRGNVYDFYVSSGGAWKWLVSYTYSGAPLTKCIIVVSNNSTAAPGNAILGIDFVRFYESATILP